MPPAMSPTSPIVLTSPGRPLVEWIIVGCYAYFFLIILLEVVMRYFFGYSTTWGEMTARYTHVYFAYLAAAEAFRHDSHIRVDYLPQRLRGRARLILEMYIDALCVLVAAAVCYYSLEVVAMQISAGFKMQGLPLNMAFATGAIPVGWGLMIIRIAQRLVRRYARGGVNADVGGAE
jgi:TRAP-type C4-dicarboxylate transport system permease small subunit